MAGVTARRRVKIRPFRVTDCVSYIDTIHVLFPAQVPRELDEGLGASVAWPSLPQKRRYIHQRIEHRSGGWASKRIVHQPTSQTMALLESTEVPCRLVRVDIALDLLVPTRLEASRAWEYVLARIVKKGGRYSSPLKFAASANKEDDADAAGATLVRAKPREPGGTLLDDALTELPNETAYLNRWPRQGDEIAMYADRPTKTASSGSCLHIEWRSYGAAALKNNGLSTVSELVALDHRAFWNTRLCLRRAPSSARLAHAMRLRRQRSQADDRRHVSALRMASLYRRANLSGPSGEVISHDLLHLLSGTTMFRGFRPIGLFETESHAWMLPGDMNALWRDASQDDS